MKDLILDGKKVQVLRDKEVKCGFRILYDDGENGIKKAYIDRRDSYSGYYRVFLGTAKEAKAQEIPFFYLHKIVMAYYCGWNRLDIAANHHVHHIIHDEEYKRTINYNDIGNLIYVPSGEHTKIHYYERLIKELQQKDNLSEEDKTRLEDAIEALRNIVSKYVAIRYNTQKKNGVL